MVLKVLEGHADLLSILIRKLSAPDSGTLYIVLSGKSYMSLYNTQIEIDNCRIRILRILNYVDKISMFLFYICMIILQWFFFCI